MGSSIDIVGWETNTYKHNVTEASFMVVNDNCNSQSSKGVYLGSGLEM